MKGSQLFERPARVLRTKDVVEDLSEPGRDGTELRALNALGKLYRRQPFGDVLARIDDPRVVIEGRDDLGKPELGDGTDIGQTRKAADRELDRKGELLLNLFRIERGGHRVDLDLDGCCVREGVNWCARRRVDPAADQGKAQQQEQEAVAK